MVGVLFCMSNITVWLHAKYSCNKNSKSASSGTRASMVQRFCKQVTFTCDSAILTMDISQMALQIFHLKILHFLVVGLVCLPLFGPLPPHIHAVCTWAPLHGVFPACWMLWDGSTWNSEILAKSASSGTRTSMVQRSCKQVTFTCDQCNTHNGHFLNGVNF